MNNCAKVSVIKVRSIYCFSSWSEKNEIVLDIQKFLGYYDSNSETEGLRSCEAGIFAESITPAPFFAKKKNGLCVKRRMP